MVDPLLTTPFRWSHIPTLLSLTAPECPGILRVGTYPVEELRKMDRKNGASATAVAHPGSVRDRNKDPQRKPSKARQKVWKRAMILVIIMIDVLSISVLVWVNPEHLPLLLILPVISMMFGWEYLGTTQGRRRYRWLP